MAAAALIIGILSSVFSIAHNGYLIGWDVAHPNQTPAASAPQSRAVIDMTPVESNRSLGGK